MNRPWFALVCAGAVALSGCRSPICPWCGHDIRTRPDKSQIPMYLSAGTIHGTVTTLERMQLHPLADVQVELYDLSVFAGGQPRLVASKTFPHPTTLPLSFDLDYPAETIDTSHDYSVSAKILVSGKTYFRTDTRYAVLTRGAPSSVQLVLMRNP